MSTKYLEANTATGNFSGRNAHYAGSESGDSDEEHNVNNRPYQDDEKNIRPLEHSETNTSIKSISHEDHSHHKFYKPFQNRTPVLCVFLLAIGACILLMELAISTHPNANSVSNVMQRSIESDSSGRPLKQVAYDSVLNVRDTLGQIKRDDAGWAKRSSEAETTATSIEQSSTKATTKDVASASIEQESNDTSKPTTTKQAEITNTSSTKEIIESAKSSDTGDSDITGFTFIQLNTESTKLSPTSQTDITGITFTQLNPETSAIVQSASSIESSSPTRSFPVVSAPPPSKQLVTISSTVASSKQEEAPIPILGLGSTSDTPTTTSMSPKRQETTPAELNEKVVTSEPAITSIALTTPTPPTSNGATTNPPSSEPASTPKPGQPPPNSLIVTSQPVTTPKPNSQMADSSDFLVTSPAPPKTISNQAPPTDHLVTDTPTTGPPMPGQPPPTNILVTDSTSSERKTTPPPTSKESPNPLNNLVTSKPTTDGTQPDPLLLVTSPTQTVGQPAPNSVLVTSSPNAPGQPAPNSLLTTTSNGPSSTRPVSQASPNPQSQLVTTNANGKIDGTAVSVTTNKVVATVTGSNGVISTITSAVVSVIGTAGQKASIVSGSVLVSGTSTIGIIDVAAVAAGQTGTVSGARAGLLTLTDSRGSATATLSFTGAVVLTDSNGQATATVSYTVPPVGLPTSSTNSDSSNVAPERDVAWNQFSYFFAKYLPNILAVVLQAVWLIIFSTFKMMEPFYQLASPRGASAESSLTADYLSAGLSLSFLKAALDGHWVMLLAGFVQLLLAFTVSFSSDAFNVVPTAFCQTDLGRQPCAPKWVVNIPVARTVEVLLIGCFSMVLMIIVFNIRRVSGVYTDPSKIATMADVLVHRPFIQELRDLPASATVAEIELDLKDNRYMLGTFPVNGREQYGIIKLNVLPQSFQKEPYMTRLGRRFDFWWENVVENFERKLPYASDFMCLFFAIALWSIVLAYYLIPGTDENNPLNQFMGRGKIRFGPSFVLSMIAVSMGFLLKHKERDYRLSHPYVVMSKGPQPADQCITAGLRSTQYSALPKAIRSKDFTLALLSFAAIISDLNLLLVPGIPWTSSQTIEVYRGSTYGCLTIISIIIVVHIRVTFKQWRRGHHVESPATLAAVLMRLCGSRFVEEKNNQAIYGPASRTEFWEDDNARQRTRYGGADEVRKYRFGCMEGVDGVQRYMIEEDFWSLRQPNSGPERSQVKYA